MTANEIGFVASAGFMILVTIAAAMAMNFAFKTRKFELVEALSIRKGIYQNVRTGKLVEVRSLSGSTLYITDDTGGYNIHAKTFDENYKFLGEL